MEDSCPCSSGKTYEKCCKPLHNGALAKDALNLMRSRFAAYALDIPEYIINTTHPASPKYSENTLSWKRSVSQFSKSSSFDRLEILDFQEQDSVATVTFIAHITQDGQDATFTEKSFFEKFQGKWLYRASQLTQGQIPNPVIDQLRLLPLAYYGDPILRKKATPIAKITEETKKLIDAMIDTMDACNGIGLAAPQIHHSIRLFIIRAPIENGDHYTPGEVQIFINPKLSDPSKATWTLNEGCLSLPTIHGDVTRPKEITVEFQDLEGKTHTKRCSGWEARVILHENDHLNGTLFIDRLDPKHREKIHPFLKKLKKRIHDGSEL